jgi:DNA-binding response OmpR family regulator
MTSKGTILIVEDQAGFRRIYEDVLVSDGYEVLIAEDGEKGWLLSKEKKPDLVLLDLGLPKMDGFEVLGRMRADGDTKSIPVIIFSVMGEHKDIQKALEMGANDYTVKGFYTPKQVLSKIKDLMSRTKAPDTQVGFKIGFDPEQWDFGKLQAELGLPEKNICPHCGGEIVIEVLPDFVRDGAHWFSTRWVCSQCGKAF